MNAATPSRLTMPAAAAATAKTDAARPSPSATISRVRRGMRSTQAPAGKERSSQAALCAATSRPSMPGPAPRTSVAVSGRVASASWSAAWVPEAAPSRAVKGFMIAVL